MANYESEKCEEKSVPVITALLSDIKRQQREIGEITLNLKQISGRVCTLIEKPVNPDAKNEVRDSTVKTELIDIVHHNNNLIASLNDIYGHLNALV